MPTQSRVQPLADVFFYYLQKEPTRSTLLQRELAQNSNARRAVLAEIVGLAAIVSERTETREYAEATVSLLSRVRQAGHPPELATEEGLRQYYTFLEGIINPTYEELRHA